ncbi:MAG: thioredoxin domain-containing protein [Sphingomonas sp.]|uniref:DsbA family protein n=1 Tax=Sphingomonas sp. TaxID=28214 RepID=UPI001AD50781|nr:thioredoxin domain-containing protein [Sphingomonas sp.]MBN8808533.1 thioredoxin domain-containing protein [Sphingomonas sp.]
MKLLAALVVSIAVVAPLTDATATPTRRTAARHRPAAAVDWNRRVSWTADGGFRVGNPAAKVKFVEYGSLTCPYCQQFYAEAAVPLRARIAGGTVSFEFRPFTVHDADPILHALLLCAGPANFSRFTDDFYADQEDLVAPFEQWVTVNPAIDAVADAATRIKLAREWGFTAFAAKHGLSPARATACLTDRNAIAAQQAREERAYREHHVDGTPIFFLNDQPLAAATWAEVDAAIAAALG